MSLWPISFGYGGGGMGCRRISGAWIFLLIMGVSIVSECPSATPGSPRCKMGHEIRGRAQRLYRNNNPRVRLGSGNPYSRRDSASLQSPASPPDPAANGTELQSPRSVLDAC